MNGLNHLLNESDLTYGPTFNKNIVDYANRYLPDNFTPQSHPNISAFQNQLNHVAEDSIPVRNINDIVDQSRKIANSASGEERIYLNNIAEAIEQRAANPREGEVLRGADQNLAIYQQKLGLAKRLEKAETLKDMIDNRQFGVYPWTRNEEQFNRIANNLKEHFGDNTPYELTGLKTAVIGSPMQKMLEPSAANYIAGNGNSIRQLVEKNIYDHTVKPVAENLIQIMQEQHNRKILGLALNGGVENAITPQKWEKLLDFFGKETTSIEAKSYTTKKLNTILQ